VSDMQKTIFLVDDSSVNLLMGKNVLSGAYNVFTTISGVNLFQALENTTPDLILLDIELPEMNGYEILKRLKDNASTAAIPVVFLTSLKSDEARRKGLSMGAADYITKPFLPMLLLKCVELHIRIAEEEANVAATAKNTPEATVVLQVPKVRATL